MHILPQWLITASLPNMWKAMAKPLFLIPSFDWEYTDQGPIWWNYQRHIMTMLGRHYLSNMIELAKQWCDDQRWTDKGELQIPINVIFCLSEISGRRILSMPSSNAGIELKLLHRPEHVIVAMALLGQLTDGPKVKIKQDHTTKTIPTSVIDQIIADNDTKMIIFTNNGIIVNGQFVLSRLTFLPVEEEEMA